MAGQIYRSVKVVVQNSTNENLTIQGVAALVGQWADKMAPTQGFVLAQQTAAEWMSVSTELCVGTSAFVRFGSSRGYLTIRWSQPWMGPFRPTVEAVPDLTIDSTIDSTNPDAVVLLATISDCRRTTNPRSDAELGPASEVKPTLEVKPGPKLPKGGADVKPGPTPEMVAG